MSPSQRISIYAELLQSRRQISIACTLPSPASSSTAAWVSPDGLVFTVTHNGSNETIRLPEVVARYRQLPITRLGGTSLEWAVPLPATSVNPLDDEAVPWSALELEPGSAVTCRTCQATIVGPGTLKEWKNLPSKNFEEMMEFWTCHKPQDHTNSDRRHDPNLRTTGQPGIGLVNFTSFLLAASDFVKLSVSPSIDIHDLDKEVNGKVTFHCASCKTLLGVQSKDISSVLIFKWNVIVQRLNHNIPNTYPSLAQCVNAELLANTRSGTPKCILLPMKTAEGSKTKDDSQAPDELLYIWMLNAIVYSSTEAPASPIPATKIFYQTVTQKEATAMLEPLTSRVEEFYLPSEAIATIKDVLHRSTCLLPARIRKFQEWDIGHLEKWSDKRGTSYDTSTRQLFLRGEYNTGVHA
ncbi:ubiquitin-conjugating enzyme E2-binding protein [Xylaria arbuscula]|nr:ubiquitin-conjugating enzyme E2-binding protein [Xylaria arbuscula]